MIIAALICLVSPLTLASEDVDLYSVVVEAKTKNSAERQKLSQIALAAVYVKASGDAGVLEKYPALRRYTESASRYISSFEYTLGEPIANIEVQNTSLEQAAELSREIEFNEVALNEIVLEEVAEQILPDKRLLLQLSFDNNIVRNSLKDANAPFWQNPRPRVLVWLVVQKGSNRELVNPETDVDLLALLTHQAQIRGLPLAQPLQDLEEQLIVDAETIWSLSLDAILAASKRYAVDMVLVGKVAVTYDQRWLGQWSTVENGQVKTQRFESAAHAGFLRLGIDMAANQLADSFTVSKSWVSAEQPLKLIVEQINTASSYMQLVKYLDSVDVLNELRLVQIIQNRCYFEFESSGEPEKLRALLELGGKLRANNKYGFQDRELVFDWDGP